MLLFEFWVVIFGAFLISLPFVIAGYLVKLASVTNALKKERGPN
jgi:ABC-type tungstate transport system substrate-binding protein